MSKQPSYYTEPPSDGFQQFMDSAAKLLFWAGVAATAVATVFLVFTFFTFSGGTDASPVQAESNISIFEKVLIAGMVAAGVGSTFMFWGEEVLGAFQLIAAAVFYFAPFYIPSMTGQSSVNAIAATALRTIQTGGAVFGLLAICVLVTDVLMRIRVRSMQGTRSDQLKYGKGVKEERDIQNVFMGRCWQLPYCRKFVRERCPIYHARRTCWKERVGCMCEEDVIRSAMENRPIPKDMVAAAKMIPYNRKLPLEAKILRCRQCVIYNEHQKHKYRLALPAALVGYAGIIALFWHPLMALMASLIARIDKVVGIATYREGAGGSGFIAPISFQIVLLLCIAVVVLTYTLRIIEYVVFKAKL